MGRPDWWLSIMHVIVYTFNKISECQYVPDLRIHRVSRTQSYLHGLVERQKNKPVSEKEVVEGWEYFWTGWPLSS